MVLTHFLVQANFPSFDEFKNMGSRIWLPSENP